MIKNRGIIFERSNIADSEVLCTDALNARTSPVSLATITPASFWRRDAGVAANGPIVSL